MATHSRCGIAVLAWAYVSMTGLLVMDQRPVSAAEVEVVEQVPIDVVLANPASYQMREIALKGVVKKITYVEPNASGRELCRAAIAFTLSDATGSIEVDLGPFCHSGGKVEPASKVPEISVGDSVIAGVRIVPGGMLEKSVDLAPKPNVVRAVARGRIFNLSALSRPR